MNVVICNAPWVVHENRLRIRKPALPYTIDQERCNACTLCVRALGCPAIFVRDEKYWIDPNLCDGCDLCASVCNQDAIHQVKEDGGRA